VLEADRSNPKQLNAGNDPGNTPGDLWRDVFSSTKD